MVIVAGEVGDRHLRVGKRFLDQFFDLGRGHGHGERLSVCRRNFVRRPYRRETSFHARGADAASATSPSPATATALIRAGRADQSGGTPRLRAFADDACRLRRAARANDVARLILAEEETGSPRRRAGSATSRADISGHRHFGERDEQAAVGNIVHRVDAARFDQPAHEIAVASSRRRDRRAARRLLPCLRSRADRATGRDGLSSRRSE